MTLDDFITKARSAHGDKYDYSKVEYVNLKTPILVICPEHGSFSITPNAHLNGVRCPECDCLYYKAERKKEELIRRIAFPLPKSFVAIDFETLYSQQVSACSVGMVKFKDGVITDKYHSFIKPPKEYDGKKGDIKTNIHNITEALLESKRTMVDVLPEMEQFIEGLPLVAHHATTEKYCIKNTTEFYGIQTILDYNHIYDTQDISELVEITEGRLISGEDSHALETVCQRFGVEEKEHHEALDDARVCGELFNIFIKKLDNGFTIKWPIKEEVYQSTKSKRILLFLEKKYNPEDKIPRTDMDNIPDNPFKSKAVCLTGFLDRKVSQQYGHQLWCLGAHLKEGVSSKLDVLIVGKGDCKSKLAKAQQLGKEIIIEDDLLSILQQIPHYECLDLFK